MERADAAIHTPEVPLNQGQLRDDAQGLGRLVKQFGHAVRRSMIKHGEDVLNRQYVQERIAEAATDLYASTCVLSRWDSELGQQDHDAAQDAAASFCLKTSVRRIREQIAELRDNDDQVMTQAADTVLSSS